MDEPTPQDERLPEGEELLGPDHRTNRYAVPLATLVGGAFVAHTDQVELQPEPPVQIDAMPGPLWAADGGVADAD